MTITVMVKVPPIWDNFSYSVKDVPEYLILFYSYAYKDSIEISS